ncbi:hypothetical protein [Brotaphodocola sp.]|uniref:hypothetical protein n=1 Tax=Brotaphodocola sp. TaxID=3073577 RepID=UPI003D7C4D89
MARRARRTPLERYEDELAQTYASIEQYENCLETLKERASKIQDQILMEKFRQVNELLENQNLSLDDLREMLCQESGGQQKCPEEADEPENEENNEENMENSENTGIPQIAS